MCFLTVVNHMCLASLVVEDIAHMIGCPGSILSQVLHFFQLKQGIKLMESGCTGQILCKMTFIFLSQESLFNALHFMSSRNALRHLFVGFFIKLFSDCI